MISFSENSMINLQKINSKDINVNVKSLILEDENVIGVYKTIRDQIIFTDKRIMTVDVKGITGKKTRNFFITLFENSIFWCTNRWICRTNSRFRISIIF